MGATGYNGGHCSDSPLMRFTPLSTGQYTHEVTVQGWIDALWVEVFLLDETRSPYALPNYEEAHADQ